MLNSYGKTYLGKLIFYTNKTLRYKIIFRANEMVLDY